MALSLRLLANVLLVVASSSLPTKASSSLPTKASPRLPTKASSNLPKLPNKVDAVASCSKTGLRKAVAEVRCDLIPGCQIPVVKIVKSSFHPDIFQASLVVMAKAVEVRKASGGMHQVVMQVCRSDWS